jgi:hypothetical protein
MKKLFLLAAFIGALIFTQTTQAQPILSGLYNSISNQLFIVSNTPPVDSKLAKSLTAALAAIHKSSGNTNLTASIKALSSATSIVNHTSVSNVLQGDLHAAIVLCVDQYVAVATAYSNQVVVLFPSTARTKALDTISNLQVTLADISANPDNAVAVKALSGISKKITAVKKAVAAAEKASPTPTVTATASITGLAAFNFQSQSVVGQQVAAGSFNIEASEAAGTGNNAGLYGIVLQFNGCVPGPNNVSVSVAEYRKLGIGSTAGDFLSTGGTVQVDWDPAHKALSGSFTFNVLEQGGSRTGTVTGNFLVFYP